MVDDAASLTRACLDPWSYLEITPTMGLKPCCNKNPITSWARTGETPEDLRNSPPFQNLRAELLAGRLGSDCKNCHIRPMVPVEQFRASFQNRKAAWWNRARRSNSKDARLQSLPLRSLRLEITTECNLRCVYCAVSQSWYRGVEMPAASFDDVVEFVRAQPKGVDVLVNGHGETTHHRDWLQICRKLIETGVRPGITTNLAKLLTPEEAACLAEFATVQVSLDTVDAVLLAQLRRRVKLSTIIDNIQKIRAAAAKKNVRGPQFTVSCGVYDANYRGLEELARFSMSLDIRSVTFWQLCKYEDLPDARNVYPIPSLDVDRITEAIGHLERSLQLLSQARIPTSVAGEFLDEWRRITARAPLEDELLGGEAGADGVILRSGVDDGLNHRGR
jgi:sulfatase maturation enzyme AslB (radical SAM superfamily)